jgi:hypothetical protein
MSIIGPGHIHISSTADIYGGANRGEGDMTCVTSRPDSTARDLARRVQSGQGADFLWSRFSSNTPHLVDGNIQHFFVFLLLVTIYECLYPQ